MKLSVRNRLTIGFALMAFMVLQLIFGNFNVLRRIRQVQAEFSTHSARTMLAQRLASAPYRLQAAIGAVQLDPEREDAIAAWRRVVVSVRQEVDALRRASRSAEERPYVQRHAELVEQLAGRFQNELLPLLQNDTVAVEDSGAEAKAERDAVAQQSALIGETVVELQRSVDEFNEFLDDQFEQKQAMMSGTLDQMRGLNMVVGVLTVIVAALVAYLTARSIVRPLSSIGGNLRMGAEQVSEASEQLATTGQMMSQSAGRQASSLEEVSGSLEEMSGVTKQNAANAKEADEMAAGANRAVDEGAAAVQRMNESIERISASADQTSRIIKTIDEIAMQTNLLALNAAVEAARAGDAGRGFAVVAEEVRSLAMRSAEAARSTAELIEDSRRNTQDGVAASEEVTRSLTRIADSIAKVSGLISGVSAASEEQSLGIEQVTAAVAQMDSITQDTAASAEESASAGEELAGQAQSLYGLVSELTLLCGRKGDDADTAGASCRWVPPARAESPLPEETSPSHTEQPHEQAANS
ncbi:MAG: hypothetical protein GF331_22445 [Chitinivibrionales bacterium]|nr:hypothetical protein [Chitinivibrionales bacterium]